MKKSIPLLFSFLLMLCAFINVQAQQRGIIAGLITDAETGEPIIGASVLVQGTGIGAATDVEGRYRINGVPAGEADLLVRSIGYQNQKFTVTVEARQTTVLDVQMEVQFQEFGEITIVGNRKSQLDAISQKRQSENLREVLTSNDLGRLPDINVAEATQRVAGVALETDKGEGRFVSIRGIQPSLNNVTLNSQSNLASTAGSRATALDLMPTEIISSIEVIKAITPDMEGNAVGGTVNINTLSAFEKSKPFFIFSADGLIHERQDTDNFGDTDLPFRLSGTVGQRLGKEQKFGAVVSANYFKRDFTVSVIDPDEWIFENGFFLPNENEIQLEDNERVRVGFNTDFDYRFTDDNSVYLKTLFTRSEETALNSEFELTFEGDLTDQTATSGRWSGGSQELDLSRDNETENLTSFILGTKNRFGQLTADIYGSYSRGDTEDFGPDGTWENPEATEDQIPLVYDLSDFFFDVDTPNPDFASDPSNMILRSVNLNFRDVLEENYEISGDFRYDVLFGDFPGYIKAGARYRDRSVEVDRAQTEYQLEADGVVAQNPIDLSRFRLDPFNPEQGGQDPFQHGDAEGFANFAVPNNLDDILVLDVAGTFEEEFEDDFENTEEVTAAYLMASVNFAKFNLVGGVRLEHTETTSKSRILLFDEDTDEVNIDNSFDDNSYTNWLPSLHLKYNITENLVGRASWSNTIGRPDFSALSSTAQFEFEETSTPGVFEGSLERANSDLDPFESTNYDASLSYFLPTGGLISVGGFFKDIDNQIFVDELELNDTEFRGLFFEELEIEQLANAEDAKLWGVEFTYDQAFLFLPGFWNGFGTSLNLALIDSEIEIPTRDELPLFRQPSEVFNGVLYYQKKGYELRFAASHRSEMLLSAASNIEFEDEVAAGADITDFDRFEDARTTFDLLAGYTLPNNKVRVTAQLRNLTDEAEQSFQGVDSRLDRHQLTGRTFFLAVNLSF